MLMLEHVPASTKHPQCVVTVVQDGQTRTFDCDRDMVDIVTACWRLGMRTSMSCQDIDGESWIAFRELDDRERFVAFSGLGPEQVAVTTTHVRFDPGLLIVVAERLHQAAADAIDEVVCSVRPKTDSDWAREYAADLRGALALAERLAEQTFGAQRWLHDERDWPMIQILQRLSDALYRAAEDVERQLEEFNDCVEDLLEELRTELAAAEVVATRG